MSIYLSAPFLYGVLSSLTFFFVNSYLDLSVVIYFDKNEKLLKLLCLHCTVKLLLSATKIHHKKTKYVNLIFCYGQWFL